eukprot:CAMPEP_0175075964 /NCGR_PEP_ID=MMETSP0052_2-20121109/22398_1 /TAXON_ID=51329 ORGANISM="Polytomella parva, Strain SAG 63-3" /NCGR_SAMPLE_ID=MMETSP0052_2 /ASSEMBLY_ACC=CAM_ASM_000194 /LENGTH=83 /DNA_ID=CAMNT_0016344919 /DNA_START=101 /DNA_END=348 /DNA_ORIENTATION=-
MNLRVSAEFSALAKVLTAAKTEIEALRTANAQLIRSANERADPTKYIPLSEFKTALAEARVAARRQVESSEAAAKEESRRRIV